MPGNCDPRFKGVPRNWAVAFLPYIDGESVIGYPNPNKGYGYGTWAEFYERENDARERFAFLVSSGAVERAELRRAGGSPLMGTLVDEWEDTPGPRLRVE